MVKSVFGNDRVLRVLALWYGLWQGGHFLFNLIGLADGGAGARALLAPGLEANAWKVMWASWAADLLFASPAGMLFAWRRLRGRKATAWGLASTAVSLTTAGLVYHVQWVYAGRLLLDGVAARAVLASWAVCPVLFVLLVIEALNKDM